MYSLKWNTHIHALFTEGGMDKNNKWFKKVSHTPYKYLRMSWQKLVLDVIKKNNARKMSFKERLIETFGVNPFICTNCGKDMILWEVWHHKYGVIYNALDKTNYRELIDDDIVKEDIKIYKTEQLELFYTMGKETYTAQELAELTNDNFKIC